MNTELLTKKIFFLENVITHLLKRLNEIELPEILLFKMFA